MKRKTPSPSSSLSSFPSSQPSFNYRQNHRSTYPRSYYNNGFNVHQSRRNNMNSHYNISAINNPYLYNNVNEHYNNEYNMPVRFPYVGRFMVPHENPLNSSSNRITYLEPSPSSYSSYNDEHTHQRPNLNGFLSNESLPNTGNQNWNSEFMQSSSNNICFNTPTMPLYVNSPPTTIDKSTVNCLKNQYGVPKKENEIKTEPSSYSSYNDEHTHQRPNLNGYFSNESLPNTAYQNCNNEFMQSSSNNIRFNTPTMPLHVNSPPTTIDKSPANCLKNLHGVPKKENEAKNKPENVDKWFDKTSEFLNNWSDNTDRKHSASPCSDSKRTSNRFRSPKRRSHSRRYDRTTRTNENMFSGIKEIDKLLSMTDQQIVNYEKKKCYQFSPTNVYHKTEENSKIVLGGISAFDTYDEFKQVLRNRAFEMNVLRSTYNVPCENNVKDNENKYSGNHFSSHHCSDDNSSSNDEGDTISILKELNIKKAHRNRLHPELWYNELGEYNYGPFCKCSIQSRLSGIRPNCYVGEGPFIPCLPNSNNADKLFHYRITITPLTNFFFKCPTIIEKDGKEFVFEGFSLLSHYRIPILPTCKFMRFNMVYTILYIEDKIPENFVVNELQLFYDYLFKDILELVDLDLHAFGNKDGCPQFHFMPRFVRKLSGWNKEILSMNDVLKYLLTNSELIFDENCLSALKYISMDEWKRIEDEYRDMIVTNPRTKPCSIRVDQLRRANVKETAEQIENDGYPVLVHFGIRPKFKPSSEENEKLEIKEEALQETKCQNKIRHGVTAIVSSKGFYKTGIMCDIVQHAMILPVLVCHLRFYKSLEYLEDTLNYKFKNKNLLKLALTHSSNRNHFGTNPDHARNTLTNCGINKPEYGDEEGMNNLINIKSQLRKKNEIESNIMHNERLGFLGDAVVEFVTSNHLFNMFPDFEKERLTAFRKAIVENQHLNVLATTLKLDDYFLYAHNLGNCDGFDLNRPKAYFFNALMGALYLDGGINIADRVFGETLFKGSLEHLDIWANHLKHPLQEQEPEGDRKCIETSPFLQKLTKFEDSIGIKFNHIRLLARAFTVMSVDFTNLTLGSNQNLEFLGQAVLKLIATEYFYKFFPEDKKSHLTLLRSSLLNNRTLSIICDDLDMVNYYAPNETETPRLKTKHETDLLGAFLGALYIDKGLEHCEAFSDVCFSSRLHDFISDQDIGYDPKRKLQLCFLTLNSSGEGEPDLPVYKVIKVTGPTNNRKYTVAVFFKRVRLGQASYHNKIGAEMNAANNALEVTEDIFSQFNHQSRAKVRSLQNRCLDEQENIEDTLFKLVESNTSKSESNMSDSDLAKRKLHRKLLDVLCFNKTFDEDDDYVYDDNDGGGDDDAHDEND